MTKCWASRQSDDYACDIIIAFTGFCMILMYWLIMEANSLQLFSLFDYQPRSTFFTREKFGQFMRQKGWVDDGKWLAFKFTTMTLNLAACNLENNNAILLYTNEVEER